MKCNQCDSIVVTYGNSVTVFCHEHGCPNTNKVYDKEEGEWITPEPEEDDDWWPENDGEDEEDEDDDQFNWDEDRGGTGHGDISYSDADPGL